MTLSRLTQVTQRLCVHWHLSFLEFIGSKLPARVCGCEELTLFCRKDDVNREAKDKGEWYVKHSAFFPRRINGRWETSLCRTTSLSLNQLWAICTQHFDAHQSAGKHHAIGRAFGPANTVSEANLALEADGIPHAYHANLIGWYDDPALQPPELKKHHWIAAALRFAEKFQYQNR
jgi:hypothetical protein